MFKSVSNGFVPKEEPFIFLPLTLVMTLVMERSQIWPDLGSRISNFRDISFIDTGTNINRWKFQCDQAIGVAMTNIQTFLEVRSLDVVWWPDCEWPGCEIFTTCAKKMYEQVCQKRRGAAVYEIFVKTLRGGGVKTSPPSTARVKHDILSRTYFGNCVLFYVQTNKIPNTFTKLNILQAYLACNTKHQWKPEISLRIPRQSCLYFPLPSAVRQWSGVLAKKHPQYTSWHNRKVTAVGWGRLPRSLEKISASGDRSLAHSNNGPNWWCHTSIENRQQ